MNRKILIIVLFLAGIVLGWDIHAILTFEELEDNFLDGQVVHDWHYIYVGNVPPGVARWDTETNFLQVDLFQCEESRFVEKNFVEYDCNKWQERE